MDSWEQRSIARDISGGGQGDPVARAQNEQGQSYLSTKDLLDTMLLSTREPVDRMTAVKLVLIELSQHRSRGLSTVKQIHTITLDGSFK